MAITILRCDDRLIHGQCIVKVLNDYKIDHIILVDPFTASNPVMSNIYKMSVPPTVKLEAHDVDTAVPAVEESAESGDSTLVLVKDPVVALELQKRTDKLPKALNIGPMSNRRETTKATFFSFLLDREKDACNALTNMGVRVYFQQVPGDKEIEWNDVK